MLECLLLVLDLFDSWQQDKLEGPPKVAVKYLAPPLGLHDLELYLPPGRYLVLV